MAFDSNHERLRALKAFDETKAGLKGLVDAGITAIPAIFHHPPESFAPLAPFSTDVAIPVIDLSGQRSEVVSKVKAAMEKLGFFLVVNHGVPEAAMSNMLSVVRGFHEEPVEAKELYYTRDEERHVKYSGNADLFRSPAAKWRDTMYINDADRLAEEILPPVCRGVVPEYTRLMRQLGRFLFGIVSEALGLQRGYIHGGGDGLPRGIASRLPLLPCVPGAAPHAGRRQALRRQLPHRGAQAPDCRWCASSGRIWQRCVRRWSSTGAVHHGTGLSRQSSCSVRPGQRSSRPHHLKLRSTA
uniref:Non-haem dioxygenase N-terminal domain-containing protein n=1 Tax=Triticum urartu TaxID=4572 RepID=A0A8R7Q0H3_TRIUA